MDVPALRRPLSASDDRTTLLVATGVLLVIAGGVAALIALFTVVGVVLGAAGVHHIHRAALAPLLPALLPPALLLAVGVGLIRLRRWARSLGLVVGGAWLLAGAQLFVGLAVALHDIPMYGGPQLFGAGLLVVIPFGIVAPGLVVALLARRDVARTLEARDLARRRVTDGIPLAALALAFMTATAALWFVELALVGHELPLPAGVLSSPNAAAVGHLLLAAIALVAATGIARGITLPIWISLLVTLGYGGLWLERAVSAPSRFPFVYLASLMALTLALHVVAARALLLQRRRISV